MITEAFASESQANKKFTAFAKKAEEEGFHNIAQMFRAAALSRMVESYAHLGVMDAVKTTQENLNAMIATMEEENSKTYKKYLEDAKKEGNTSVMRAFQSVVEANTAYLDILKKAQEALKSNKDAEQKKCNVCDTCGYVIMGELVDPCSVCGAAVEQFSAVE